MGKGNATEWPQCSVCGQWCGYKGDIGKPAPVHSRPGEQGPCPGSGKTLE